MLRDTVGTYCTPFDSLRWVYMYTRFASIHADYLTLDPISLPSTCIISGGPVVVRTFEEPISGVGVDSALLRYIYTSAAISAFCFIAAVA